MTEGGLPILVAPRPVRIASDPGTAFVFRSNTPFRLVSAVADRLERVKINGDLDSDDQKSPAFVDTASDRDLGSPRSSPRSSLTSEALEEFLSILKPSYFFPPSSPILRTRRNGASLPTYPYQYKARVINSRSDSISFVDDSDRVRQNSSSRSPEFIMDRDNGSGDYERHTSDGLRWFTSGALSSPISRMQTRNPFSSYDTAGLLPSNQTTPSPLSPAAVPLPSPTPEEMIEIF